MMRIWTSGLAPTLEHQDRPVIVVGLGARRDTGADEILALIETALARQGLAARSIAFCVTHPDKLDHPGLFAAAVRLGVELRAADPVEFSRPVPNPSTRVTRLFGVPAIAEAAAQSFGPLLLEKIASAGATCALSRLAYSPSAATTASTLATSSAGP
ncbi:cobalamin biosynthesis protein [Devosia sp. FJ2-5-3]|uniref:cobalamin biosynthesis protein n=1 Tax=Devosia sp. FJ2-5-3 TaxID=2976680 RepID=UPI0023D8990B|nr:cobalamin biosynthesis protein [Devosia sp. FJ2-5-3]WEJ57778.1 cobalamin biosynthesis protein [Devosia sp. FJ2-5-3]